MTIFTRDAMLPQLGFGDDPQEGDGGGWNWAADVGRGIKPWKMRRPRIYFAGRLDGSENGTDWRDAMLSQVALYELSSACQNPDGGAFGMSAVSDYGTFVYGGPFAFEPGMHSPGHSFMPDAAAHRQIWDIDQAQIADAELIVVYLEDGEAYGTLCELGYAAALNKPIALGFGATMTRHHYDELWVARMLAARVYWGTPKAIWQAVRRDWIAEARPLSPIHERLS